MSTKKKKKPELMPQSIKIFYLIFNNNYQPLTITAVRFYSWNCTVLYVVPDRWVLY